MRTGPRGRGHPGGTPSWHTTAVTQHFFHCTSDPACRAPPPLSRVKLCSSGQGDVLPRWHPSIPWDTAPLSPLAHGTGPPRLSLWNAGTGAVQGTSMPRGSTQQPLPCWIGVGLLWVPVFSFLGCWMLLFVTCKNTTISVCRYLLLHCKSQLQTLKNRQAEKCLRPVLKGHGSRRCLPHKTPLRLF